MNFFAGVDDSASSADVVSSDLPLPREPWSPQWPPDDAKTVSPTASRRETMVCALFRAQYRPLVRLARLIGAGDDRAEDLVQDAFVQIYHRWWSLRDPNKALFYLRSCVANGARDCVRASRAVCSTSADSAVSAPSAEASALQHEQEEDVLRGLARLSNRQRQVLVLRYYLDLRESEIAQMLRISPGAVKVHASRGIDNLGEYLRARQ